MSHSTISDDWPSAMPDEIARAAVDASRHAICVTDARLDEPGPQIEYVNRAYLDMFCCEPDDCIGHTPRIGQGPLTGRAVLDRVRSGLEAGETIHAQTINYRLNGEPFRIRWSIDPIRDDAGRLTHYIAILADITQEDRLRRRLLAIDALTTSLRHIDRPPAPGVIATALADALSPLIEGLGSIRVTLDRVQPPQCASQSAAAGSEVAGQIELAPIRIGDHGWVEASAHPDAATLLDVAAIGLLCEQLVWSIDRLGGLTAPTGSVEDDHEVAD